MQPLTVLIGIMFGTLFSIGFSLGAVLLIFWLQQDAHPRLAAELPELQRAVAMFTALAAVAGLSFLASLRRTKWQYAGLICLLLGLFGVGSYYWPEG